jgi:organic hydroperoxide reductase OsmC/OhrA
MQAFPHFYSVTAAAAADGVVTLQAAGIPALRSSSPAQFDGPGDRWSPETLLVAAVGDCFILTFTAIARASRLTWTDLTCVVTGTLDRVARDAQFTAFDLAVTLVLPAGTNEDQARQVLAKAERGCLIANSLKALVHLRVDIIVDEALQAISR